MSNNRPIAFDYHGIHVEWLNASVKAGLLTQLRHERQRTAFTITGMVGTADAKPALQRKSVDGSLIDEATRIFKKPNDWL